MAGTVWTSAESTNNPIEWIKTSTTGTAKYIKCPSGYNVELDDISTPDAGRSADGQMHKSTLTVYGNVVRARALSLEWQNITDMDIAGILSVLQQQEYLYVKYYNPAAGAYLTEWFYLGNRNMPMYNKAMGIWTALSTKLISQNRV